MCLRRLMQSAAHFYSLKNGYQISQGAGVTPLREIYYYVCIKHCPWLVPALQTISWTLHLKVGRMPSSTVCLHIDHLETMHG